MKHLLVVGSGIAGLIAAIEPLLWNNVGIERTRSGLQAAAAQLNAWHSEGTTVHALETANLLSLARVIVPAKQDVPC